MMKFSTLVAILLVLGSYGESAAQEESINLAHWRLTLPIDSDGNGKPDNYGPEEMQSALNNGSLKPYFYQAEDGALVFYCERNKDMATTPNSNYPRCELREHINPGDYHTNWTLDEGGELSGKIQVTQSTLNDRFMIFQIHGRLTREQRDLIGKKDYDAPPLLKIYYNNGQIEVAYKELKDKNYSGEELLQKSNWTDAQHYFFKDKVNHQVFTLQIRADRSGFVITLNNRQKRIVAADLKNWPFENYFKAGNYLTSRSESAKSEVKFYELEIKH